MSATLHPHPATSPVGALAGRLLDHGADLGCDRACILVLVRTGVRAALIADGLDDAMAEARRRHALPEGPAVGLDGSALDRPAA